LALIVTTLLATESVATSLYSNRFPLRSAGRQNPAGAVCSCPDVPAAQTMPPPRKPVMLSRKFFHAAVHDKLLPLPDVPYGAITEVIGSGRGP